MAARRLAAGPHRPASLGLGSHQRLWGVYVGDGCVTGADPLEWLAIKAHAHVADDPWAGWICIADRDQVLTGTGRPTHLLIHELAHISTNTTKHDRRWRDEATRMGARREAAKYERNK
jgi:hypothetical protein